MRVGAAKNSVGWRVEKAMHYFVHANKVTTGSSTDPGKESKPFTHFNTIFEHFLAPDNPGKEWKEVNCTAYSRFG